MNDVKAAAFKSVNQKLLGDIKILKDSLKQAEKDNQTKKETIKQLIATIDKQNEIKEDLEGHLEHWATLYSESQEKIRRLEETIKTLTGVFGKEEQ